ncbi:MDR family MFS transporter [Devosia nitrariae]|uniref:MFS transporter n=1 Tax=Devosia nitrariae TaxID=2071872 RepID=A0ABQ5VZC7_9HYPH|nr:MDR family MFS transporter [Devosia nitrariae]GLQ52954.1 MFS transporter [Devosia nitrariae]
MSAEPTMNTSNAPAGGGDLAARNRLVILILLVSAFVVILNETIMVVALPRLMDDLGVTANAVQWLTTAFMLTMAVVIPVTGFLLQRLNTRPVFILAMSTFAAGTTICAVSPGLELLIVGRVVQACGTAIMMPLLMTTVMNLVPPENRGKTMGDISLVISVAPALGPTVSGLILNVLDWRWIFIVVVPIALAALYFGWRRMVNVTTPRYAPVDVVSVILSVFAFGGIVYGLSLMGEGGEAATPVPAWVPVVVGGVALVVFILRQLLLQKRDQALLDLRTFLSKTFSLSIFMMAVFMMAMFGVFVLLPIYLQNVLGLETLQIGLLLLPGGLTMGILARYVGRLYDRFGPTVLVVPGSAVVCMVLWSLTFMDQNTSPLFVLAAHVVLSVGLAFLFTPLFTASLGSLPPHLYSHGSAVLGTIQQVAGAAGVALFVALMSLRSSAELAAGAPEPVALSAGIQLAFQAGAIISVLTVLAAFLIRRPEPAGVPAEAAGH